MDASEIRITRLTVGRTTDLGNYESIRFDVTAEVLDGQSWQEVMDHLKALVNEEDRLIREEFGRPPRKPVTLLPSTMPENGKAATPSKAQPPKPQTPVQPMKIDAKEFRNDPQIKSAVADFAKRNGLRMPKT